MESHHHLYDRFTEVSLSGNSVMAQGSHTLFAFKTSLALACPVQAVMACFGTARLFHTSCRIVRIQLSVSDAFKSASQIRYIYTSSQISNLSAPYLWISRNRISFSFPSAFPYSLHSVSSSVSVRVLVYGL